MNAVNIVVGLGAVRAVQEVRAVVSVKAAKTAKAESEQWRELCEGKQERRAKRRNTQREIALRKHL
jgi:hypothetical protein